MNNVSIDLEDMVFLKCLMWWEGPLLDLYEYQGHKVLVKFGDATETECLWFCFRITEEDLKEYLEHRKTLFSLEQAVTEFWFGPANKMAPVGRSAVEAFFANENSLLDDTLAPPAN